MKSNTVSIFILSTYIEACNIGYRSATIISKKKSMMLGTYILASNKIEWHWQIYQKLEHRPCGGVICRYIQCEARIGRPPMHKSWVAPLRLHQVQPEPILTGAVMQFIGICPKILGYEGPSWPMFAEWFGIWTYHRSYWRTASVGRQSRMYLGAYASDVGA